MSPLRLLLVEDSDDDALMVLRQVERSFPDVHSERVQIAEAFSARLREQEWDVIVCDDRLPCFNSAAAFELLRESGLDVPFIIVSGSIGEEAAVEAMRRGASDYLLKNDLARLVPAIERELREAGDRRERRRVEQALRAVVERNRRIIETSHEGILTIDVEARIDFVNARMVEMFGYTTDEVLGRTLLDFVDEDERYAASTNLAQSRQGLAGSVELKLRRKDHTRIDVAVTSTPILSDGKFAGAFAMVADITEQKQMMAQLMVSDRMASVGTLAAGVAHEINNPLAAVIGNLEMIATDLERLPEAAPRDRALLQREIEASLADARDAADRVRLIVRDLKIFSKPEEEKCGPVDVRAVMESSLRMAWNEIRHRARLVRDYGDVPPVEANEARLGQVFLNLVVNAAQALEPGRTEHHQIRVVTRDDHAGHVIVEVHDTGAGISRETQRRIFEPFFTTKAVGIGTGLGLSICHRIVNAFGGEIGVESELGKGSVFRVVLPVARTEDKTKAPTASKPLAGRRGRVLIVDDDELVARSVRRLLAPDHDVEIANTARRGLELCAHERFDVILCDLMMPEMTGMELHAELTRVAPEQAERMVFVTGGAFTAAARQFLAEVPNEHLEKPFDAGELRALLRRRLS